MPSSPLQISDTAVDMFGVSTATSTPSGTDERAGSIYRPATLAACTPVYVTSLESDTYLMMFSRRWLDATPSATQPGYYTDYTASATPGWVSFNGSHGTIVSPVEDIPMSTPHDSVTLTAACARPPYTYLLNTVTSGSSVTAVVQHVMFNQPMRTLSILNEETVPNAALFDFPVDVTYNLPGGPEIVLTPDVLARIFSGSIYQWTDPAILALNPGVDFPDFTLIQVIFDLDASADTAAFQSYLEAESPYWDSGTSTSYTGFGVGAVDVASSVATTPASIGFVGKGTADPAAVIVTPVRFDRGLYISGQNLVVFGASYSGKVCLARKNWGRIGFPTTEWEFFDGAGWSANLTAISPVLTTTGTPVLTAGPVSVATYDRQVFLSAVIPAADGDRSAQVYLQDARSQWQPVGDQIYLGSAVDGTYTGGTLQFQPQLSAIDYLVNVPDAIGAIPVCVTMEQSITEETVTDIFVTSTALDVTWGLWQVDRSF
jgi:hypothetical protein